MKPSAVSTGVRSAASRQWGPTAKVLSASDQDQSQQRQANPVRQQRYGENADLGEGCAPRSVQLQRQVASSATPGRMGMGVCPHTAGGGDGTRIEGDASKWSRRCPNPVSVISRLRGTWP